MFLSSSVGGGSSFQVYNQVVEVSYQVQISDFKILCFLGVLGLKESKKVILAALSVWLSVCLSVYTKRICVRGFLKTAHPIITKFIPNVGLDRDQV